MTDTDKEDDRIERKSPGKKLAEAFHGDDTPATREQMAQVIDAMTKVEVLFTKLLTLMTDVKKSPEAAAAAGEAFMNVMMDYKSSVAGAAVSMLKDVEKDQSK